VARPSWPCLHCRKASYGGLQKHSIYKDDVHPFSPAAVSAGSIKTVLLLSYFSHLSNPFHFPTPRLPCIAPLFGAKREAKSNGLPYITLHLSQITLHLPYVTLHLPQLYHEHATSIVRRTDFNEPLLLQEKQDTPDGPE